MDVPQSVLGDWGLDGAGQQPTFWIGLGQGRIRPELIQASEAQQRFLLGEQIVRDLLAVIGLLPFVVALGGNDGPALHCS